MTPPGAATYYLDSTYYPRFTEGTGGGAVSWSPWVRSCWPVSLHPRIGMGAADPDYALRCLAVLGDVDGARCLFGKGPGQMVEDQNASRQIP